MLDTGSADPHKQQVKLYCYIALWQALVWSTVILAQDAKQPYTYILGIVATGFLNCGEKQSHLNPGLARVSPQFSGTTLRQPVIIYSFVWPMTLRIPFAHSCALTTVET